MTDWLAYGLAGRDPSTVTTNTILCNTHVIPALGSRKLRDLSADDVDHWLAAKAKVLSTRSLEAIRSCLNRAVKRAMARDKVKRNVVELCSIPAGRLGRPSKSLPLKQAEAVLTAAEDSALYAYFVVSLLTGGRTEEMRPLRWDYVDLEGDPEAVPEIPPHIAVWRSVRSTGDTKIRKSRRTLALPGRAIDALKIQRERQGRQRVAAGDQWQENGLVFTSAVGTELDAANVRREFRKVLARAARMPEIQMPETEIKPDDWTTRETRTSFVSILSDRGIPLEEISRLVGHSSTAVTEVVYRKQIRPVIQTGAVAMDGIFGTPPPPER
ncbi:tyrosine-type recombinase/integrase [Streptomyces clavuligerus]|uniref:Putative phage integrase n=1 Tax=Streptomyces clavuligerus TaxID=1901 RepID=E2Q9S2_STRCL|nr:integrase [Streptomyces clavuligerus]AXU14150.1 site-specific integrase [Streptomyces clavuligerus]EFG07649.1 Putative phage integrase [Streptomyces clavuligerus]MBY6304143.1 tyrosine-type recombinase/integrase [Streptomyces clavuligerus]QCS06923.1 site-specific integrase [Streptomyces clavuligerus]